MPIPLGILATGGSAFWALGRTSAIGSDRRAIADSDGNIYWAAQTTTTRSYIFKFDSNGNQLWQKQYNHAVSTLHLDSSNNLYFRETVTESIVKINSSTGDAIWGATITGMNVDDIVTDSSSNIFIKDATNERIAKLAAAGNAISWAKQVTESTTTFRGLAIDADGNPWVTSEQNNDLRIIEFANSDGSQITTIAKDSDLNWDEIVIATNGDIYIGNTDSSSSFSIRRFNSAGTELNGISIASPPASSNTLRQLAIDSTDNIYAFFVNQSTDVAYLWKFNSSLSTTFTLGIKNLNADPIAANPELDSLSVRGSVMYVSGGGDQIWKLPNDGTLTGTYSVANSDNAVFDSYQYGTFSLTTSTPSALASDTGTATVTNPTVTVASFTPSVGTGGFTFEKTEIG